MKLEAMAIAMPEVADHPNRVPFEGVLTVVDEVSTRPPSGARGHRVVLTSDAAKAALPSLLGMAVDFAPKWDGHDARTKCGIITEADVIGKQLRVRGYLFGRDFPDVVLQISSSDSSAMGMSYELADAHVADMRAEVWTLTKATFTGAAILLREKAAYLDTSFRLLNKHRGTSRLTRPVTPSRLAAGTVARFENRHVMHSQTRKGA
ncbi:MAG TPA: hypothetical protein VHT24_14950 [Pseudacidobacterium sp.]|jgi:hypothetical protein|nr:hypothetical protein [Pseudacidobacterium sp.]